MLHFLNVNEQKNQEFRTVKKNVGVKVLGYFALSDWAQSSELRRYFRYFSPLLLLSLFLAISRYFSLLSLRRHFSLFLATSLLSLFLATSLHRYSRYFSLFLATSAISRYFSDWVLGSRFSDWVLGSWSSVRYVATSLLAICYIAISRIGVGGLATAGLMP